jgi:hypothetical protein
MASLPRLFRRTARGADPALVLENLSANLMMGTPT